MTKYIEPKIEQFSDYKVRLYPEVFPNSKSILTLTFQITEDCCMACSYCYQTNKSKKKMSFSTAKKIIDNLLTDDNYYKTQNINGIIIEFIGGEPFLEVTLIDQIVSYFIDKCLELNHRFINHFRISIASNGLLYFNENVQQFIKKYRNFLSLTISVDGNKELHDSCRLDLMGQGTYDRVIAAALDVRNIFNRTLDTKMTLSPENVQYTYDAILNLISLGYISISLNCIYEEGWTIQHAKILYQQLKKIADWLFENDSFKKYYISIFNEQYFQPLEDNDTKNWCGGICNGMLSFDPDGKAYPCIRYMNSSLNNKLPPFSIGDINGLFLSPEEQNRKSILENITRQSQSTDECIKCSIAAGCGWCSGYNYECFGTPNKRAIFICWMHKARSLANAYYYNKGYFLLNETERIKINLSKNDALQIIDEQEWDMLKSYEEVL